MEAEAAASGSQEQNVGYSSSLEGAACGMRSSAPEQLSEPVSLDPEALKSCSLNRQDGLRQYSLTPHPSMLPQDYLDQQRAESMVLLNKSLKSKIIRFVCLEIRLADGMPYSYTPNKPIISPPLLDANLLNMNTRASWQVSLSTNDPIRALPLPPEGVVLLKLKSEIFGGQYDSDDFIPTSTRGGDGCFLVPAYSSSGEGDDMHPIFNHVQISVQPRPDGKINVTRVSLVHIPEAELGNHDASEITQASPSSPPIVYPILAANFMDIASAQNKRKQPEPTLDDKDDSPVVAEDRAPGEVLSSCADDRTENTPKRPRRANPDLENTVEPARAE